MNYRHAFHAGNHADVLKHLVVSRIIALLSRKEAPLPTSTAMPASASMTCRATRRPVPASGWKASAACGMRRTCPKPLPITSACCDDLNPDGALRYYPGSPELARRLTREQDRVLLNEKHPEDGQLLKDNMKGEPPRGRAPGRRLARAARPAAGGGEARAAADRPAVREGRRAGALRHCAGRGHRPHAPDGGGDLVPDQGRAPAQAFLPGVGQIQRAPSCCAPSCSSTRRTTPAAWPVPAWPSPTRPGAWRTNSRCCCPGWPASWRRARAPGAWTG